MVDIYCSFELPTMSYATARHGKSRQTLGLLCLLVLCRRLRNTHVRLSSPSPTYLDDNSAGTAANLFLLHWM